MAPTRDVQNKNDVAKVKYPVAKYMSREIVWCTVKALTSQNQALYMYVAKTWIATDWTPLMLSNEIDKKYCYDLGLLIAIGFIIGKHGCLNCPSRKK